MNYFHKVLCHATCLTEIFSQLDDLSSRINAGVRNGEFNQAGSVRQTGILNAKPLVESAVTVLEARRQLGMLQVTSGLVCVWVLFFLFF